MKVNSEELKIDFIGVGAPKSGTTWLAACLGEHPDLCMAEPTALNYFCKNMIWPEFRACHGLGAKWVADRFVHCKPHQLLGEISPNYLYDPPSPELIFRHNPACRLIFCFRHPVDVLASFYYQIAKETPLPSTIEGFIDQYPEVQRVGLYHRHLQVFLTRFPVAQCLFLLFQDIQKDAGGVVKQCFSFLGVTPEFVPPDLYRRVNERRIPRSKAVMAAINWSRHVLQKVTPGEVQPSWVWKMKLYRLHDWVLQRNLKPFTAQPLQEATRARLLDFYREDTRALSQFLGRDLTEWER
jgi:Sulfotransferase domain